MNPGILCARTFYSEIGEICYRAGLRDGNWELSRKAEKEVRAALRTKPDVFPIILDYAQRDYEGHSPEQIRDNLVLYANISTGN